MPRVGLTLALVLAFVPALGLAPVAAAHDVYFWYTGAGTVFGAPGEPAIYRLVVRNGGAAAETVDFAIHAIPAGWSATLEFASLHLAPGERRTFNLTVIPAALPIRDDVYVNATALSTGDVSVTFVTHYHLVTPRLSFDKPAFAVNEPVGGTVALTYANGVGAASATLEYAERWQKLPPTRRTSGATDAAGEWAFSQAPDATGSHVPGTHDVSVTVQYGGRTYTTSGSYRVL